MSFILNLVRARTTIFYTKSDGINERVFRSLDCMYVRVPRERVEPGARSPIVFQLHCLANLKPSA